MTKKERNMIITGSLIIIDTKDKPIQMIFFIIDAFNITAKTKQEAA